MTIRQTTFVTKQNLMEDLIRVALVEDETDIREAMRVLINGSKNFECIYTYASGEDALKDLPGKDVNVVIMDIHLPGTNGIECVADLNLKMPKTQFMMCTVYDDDDNIFSALQSGATGYILKRNCQEGCDLTSTEKNIKFRDRNIDRTGNRNSGLSFQRLLI